jgi:hypothetical protein
MNAMAKLGSVMHKIEITKDFFLPRLSPYEPNNIPPSGRAMRPEPIIKTAYINSVKGIDKLKKLADMMGAQ